MASHHDDRRVETSADDPRLALVHNLQTLLTISSGNALTLERRLRDGQDHPPDVTLALVTLIAGSVREMATLLRQLENDET
jgi:hypothetical protein